MTESARGRRLPLASIPANYLRELPSVVGLITAGSIYVVNPDVWPGRWVFFVIGALLFVRLLHPIWERVSLRFDADGDGLWIAHGLLTRRTRYLRWRSVAALEVETPWSYRPFGLCRVEVRPRAADDTKASLPGITPATADSLTALFSAHAAARAEGSDDADEKSVVVHATVELADEGVFFRAGAKDLALASLSNGQFLIIGVGAAATAYEVLDTVGALESAAGWLNGSPVALVAAMIVLVLLAGLVLAVVRFFGFTVRQHEDELSVSYGLLTTRVRTIHLDAVIGLRGQRNLAEMLLDRVRIALITTDSGGGNANVVLPSLPRSVVRTLLERRPADGLSIDRVIAGHGGRSLPRALGIAAVTALAAGGVAAAVHARGFRLGVVVLAAALCVLAVAGLVNLVFARIRVERDRVTLLRLGLAEREDCVQREAVHAQRVVRVLDRGPVLVSVHFFAGRPRALFVIQRRPPPFSTAPSPA